MGVHLANLRAADFVSPSEGNDLRGPSKKGEFRCGIPIISQASRWRWECCCPAHRLFQRQSGGTHTATGSSTETTFAATTVAWTGSATIWHATVPVWLRTYAAAVTTPPAAT